MDQAKMDLYTGLVAEFNYTKFGDDDYSAAVRRRECCRMRNSKKSLNFVKANSDTKEPKKVVQELARFHNSQLKSFDKKKPKLERPNILPVQIDKSVGQTDKIQLKIDSINKRVFAVNVEIAYLCRDISELNGLV